MVLRERGKGKQRKTFIEPVKGKVIIKGQNNKLFKNNFNYHNNNF